jgi:hypothetical protein
MRNPPETGFTFGGDPTGYADCRFILPFPDLGPIPAFSLASVEFRMDPSVIGRCALADHLRRFKMNAAVWTEADSNRAQAIWSEYQRHHDLSQMIGQTAGIDPSSGSTWFGESIQDVIPQRDADGSDAPLFFIRVGSATYHRKGGHR